MDLYNLFSKSVKWLTSRILSGMTRLHKKLCDKKAGDSDRP